jgi:hypothetical protein
VAVSAPGRDLDLAVQPPVGGRLDARASEERGPSGVLLVEVSLPGNALDLLPETRDLPGIEEKRWSFCTHGIGLPTGDDGQDEDG